MQLPTLKFYKLHPSVIIPTFGTQGSACFDLAYNPMHIETAEIKGYSETNGPVSRQVNPIGTFTIMPGDRLLVPVGFILDIPEGYSVRFHARSGLSLKQGLILANNEAVIDSDYVEEVYVMLTNVSAVGQFIAVGDRIAQGELVKSVEYVLSPTEIKPMHKTDRIGGYGSTGR